MAQTNTRPTWDEYRAIPRGHDINAAIAILEAEQGRQVQRDAAQWLNVSPDNQRRDDDGVVRPIPMLDWTGWVEDVDSRGRGWSSTAHRIFQVAAALAADRPLQITGTLDATGSWEAEVWEALVNWGTGGDNRQHPGRSVAKVITPLPAWLT